MTFDVLLNMVCACARQREPLAGGWTAVENVCQRIRELCVLFVFERRPTITFVYIVTLIDCARRAKAPNHRNHG